ncbi:hypothetical protein K5D33_11270 [Pseudomonas cichorii]|nr:hypothetical protein [Pseudomonas cichorii]MBX8535302.1 hypothetical protein [Pseudomonas cichorii]MBX8555249.1 hypothetical protein [Pseudomonas cichorii]MBX8562161.1 hypothetical protein [Pseudomonas cichorii]MBX8601785.1 hypothetical protein [Pseudomonas cichorii]
MIRAWFLVLLLLGGCASQAPLPAAMPPLQLPMQLHIQREQADQRQDWLLIIQRENAGLRWSLMDPLGIPQARQLLIQGKWQADGLLPPNPEARELFAALLFALTPNEKLPVSYPAAQSQDTQRHLNDRWRVDYRSATVFTLKLKEGLSYEITPLNVETSK